MPPDQTRCRAFDDDYSALIDGELVAERADELTRHLAGCDRCRARVASLRRVDERVSARARPALPADLRARLQARIDADAEETSGASDGGARDRDAPPRRRRWLEVRVAAALAAAAAAVAYLVALDEPLAPEEPVETARTPAPVAPEEPVETPRTPAPVAPAEPDLGALPVEDVAVGLELETIEDLDVIANLELLEALLALEEGTG